MKDVLVHPDADTKHLAKLLHYANESVELLSSKMKPELERMVSRAFLRCMGLPFTEDQLIVSKDEPPDTIFGLGEV